MVILKSQNKTTDFLLILVWACPFKKRLRREFIKIFILKQWDVSQEFHLGHFCVDV